MACEWELQLWGGETAYLRSAAEMAWEELERVEAMLSIYRRSSEISQINAAAARGASARTTPEVFSLLTHAADLSASFEGAFDLTCGALTDVWGFGGDGPRLPSDDEVAEALARTGYNKLRLNPSTRTVGFAVPRMRLDLGGIGKGYAVDSVLRVLGQCRVGGALVSGGGSSIGGLGSAPGGKKWLVTVNREALGDSAPVVHLGSGAVTTSGDLGQAATLGDRQYSHVIDPRTGYPAEAYSGMVTAVTTTATLGEAASTAAFVLGPMGREVVARYPGVERLLYT